MRVALPKFTAKRFVLARIVCLAVAVIVVLILSRQSWSDAVIGEVKYFLGTESSLVSILFWGLAALGIAHLLSRLVRAIWLELTRSPTEPTYIRTTDIEIHPVEGVRSIPRYRAGLQQIMNTARPDVIHVVNNLVSTGFSLGASDIHISPDGTRVAIVARVDGNLYPLGDIPQQMYPHLVRRIKILSGLPIYKHKKPLDGQLNFEDTTYTARVAIFPTAYGERIALRLADVHARIMDLDNIGVPQELLLDYKSLLNRNQGMIVITGPTGSGKSTTMFSSLLHIQNTRKDSVNIVTLEDPIETHLEGFFQTQIDQDAGMTFSTGLRSVLRQDPDVIMLGEIRDEETASIATRAAMTGHLLITTVHASSTPGVFNRLSQMGIGPVDLATSVRAVVSQRLCRKLCRSCRRKTEITEEHRRQFRLMGMDEIPEGPFFEADGCIDCLDLGFSGRAALFEMMLVTDSLKDHISKGIPAHQLGRMAVEEGMKTLLDHGLDLARTGTISLMELARVVSD